MKKTPIDLKNLFLKWTGFFHDLIDVFSWWRKFGKKDFPHLYLGAMIVLGKPSHNGFQERVFSLGNYKDSQLAKWRHENNFAMGVLEHVNVRMMENFESHNYIPSKATEDTVEPKDVIESFFSNKKIISKLCANFLTQSQMEEQETEDSINLDDPSENDDDFNDVANIIGQLKPGLSWSEEFEDMPDDENTKEVWKDTVAQNENATTTTKVATETPETIEIE